MSNIDLVLLGLIKQQPQSAYDIQKNVKYRHISRWVRISEQSIYKKVLQLELKEYISSYTEKNGNMPDKTIYTITEKGNIYFKKLMNEISNRELNIFIDFNAIIMNLNFVDKTEQMEIVSNIKNQILKLKETLDVRFLERGHVPETGKAIFRQQIDLVKSLEKWIIDFENNLKEGK